jgi:non-ribosomal peptide synthetase component F
VSIAEATYAQHSVWFTEQAGAGAGAYQMALGIRFDGALDEAALRRACAAVVAKHPVLGSAVDLVDGVPRLVAARHDVPVAAGPLTADLVREEIARPFPLRDGPLARFTLLGAEPGPRMLLATAHHLVFDGMSKDVLAHDLATAYNAAVAGRPVELGPAAVLDPRHVADERARVAAALPEARAYWAAHRPEAGDVILPGLRDCRVGAEPGATVAFDLEPALVDRLDTAGMTRFELLLSTVYAVLRRYGNAAVPVTIGLSTRTGRTAGHIGLFVNELPLRPPVVDGTFGEHADAVRAALRELYRFRSVPLSHALNGLRPAAMLTPVSVGYRRRAAEPAFTGVDSAVQWQLFNGVARNTLHVQLVDSPTGVAVSLQHNPAALPTDAVERIGEHFRTVLAAVLDDPATPVAELPLLSPAERRLVVEAWHGPEARARATVPELFAVRARRSPASVAVVDSGRSMSYAELDARSGALAELLRQRGIGPGALVAVCLPRSGLAVVALLAVMRAGAAYVPVDPAYPAARRALVLADAAPALVLACPATAADLSAEFPVLVLRDEWSDPASFSGMPPRPTDAAYVMYTSGSTGRPKGVVVPHGALANLLLAMRDLLGSRPDDRWLGLTSLAFDISGLELFLPLITGARVVIAPERAALDGAALDRLIRDEGVTHVQATPSGWRILLDGGLGGEQPVVALAGGEALPPGLAGELRARATRLCNVYGPTETTIWSTAADLSTEGERLGWADRREADRREAHRASLGDRLGWADQREAHRASLGDVTIGRPIANTSAYVPWAPTSARSTTTRRPS